MASDKKYIRFIDSNYNTLFHVPDGGAVLVTSGYDGSVNGYTCKYIDECHTEIGNNVYHICQFAELMERNGNKYAPAREIGDLDFYQKRYFDRENLGEDGEPVPYYALLEKAEKVGSIKGEHITKVDARVIYAYCPAPSSPDKTFCVSAISLHGYEALTNGGKQFALRIEDLCEDYSVCARINNIVHAIKEEQKTVDDILNGAVARSGQTKSAGQEKENVSFDYE